MPSSRDILGVSSTATAKEIKAQFYKMALKYHPDKNIGNEETARKKFIRVQMAYENLVSDIDNPDPDPKPDPSRSSTSIPVPTYFRSHGFRPQQRRQDSHPKTSRPPTPPPKPFKPPKPRRHWPSNTTSPNPPPEFSDPWPQRTCPRTLPPPSTLPRATPDLPTHLTLLSRFGQCISQLSTLDSLADDLSIHLLATNVDSSMDCSVIRIKLWILSEKTMHYNLFNDLEQTRWWILPKPSKTSAPASNSTDGRYSDNNVDPPENIARRQAYWYLCTILNDAARDKMRLLMNWMQVIVETYVAGNKAVRLMDEVAFVRRCREFFPEEQEEGY